MALIKCAECGKEFSNKASACPKCACPIEKEKKNNDTKKTSKKKQESKKKIFVIGFVIILIFLVIIIVLNLNNKPYYIGKWEHYVHWEGIAYSQRDSYAYYQFFKDNTFKYEGYTIGNDDTTYNIDGTYNEKDGIVYLYYNIDGFPYSHSIQINDNKLCEIGDENCENYYIKSTSKESKQLYLNEREYLTDEDYQKILKNKGSVIVVAFSQNCSHCNDYDDVLFKLYNTQKFTIYHYDINMENASLKVDGTPTTFIIKNGKVVDKIVGVVSYDELSTRANKVFFASNNEENNSNSNNSSSNNNTKPNNDSTGSNFNNNSQSSPNNNDNTSNSSAKKSYTITSISGIGGVYDNDSHNECRVDNFTASISSTTIENKLKISYTITMTKVNQMVESYDPPCWIKISAYDSDNVVVGNDTTFIDIKLNETGRQTLDFYIDESGTDYSIKISEE